MKLQINLSEAEYLALNDLVNLEIENIQHTIELMTEDPAEIPEEIIRERFSEVRTLQSIKNKLKQTLYEKTES